MKHNYENIDATIKEFHKLLPYGGDFSEVIYELKLDYDERESIEKFLKDNDIIEYWGEYGKSIITSHGEKVFEIYGGIEKFIEHQELEKKEEIRLEKIKNQKLEFDAKLSKWQVKTFWPVFVFGLIGFIFGVFNFIDSRIKTKSIEELQQNNLNIQEEVSKLRTLVLDKKTVDSLRNSKTHVDSLRPR